MQRKRVLVAHPYLDASGGGNVVAAWALEALRDEFDVTLATLGTVDYSTLNRNFATSLRLGDFAVRVAPLPYQTVLRCLPTAGALWQICLTMRWAQDLGRREHFAVLLSTQNEMDFKRPGLQYVHFPWVFLPRPDIELRWFHRIPGILAAYRGACRLAARSSNEGLRRNLSLANSAFVAGKIKEVHGRESPILYPPVPGDFPDVPWEQKRPSMVAAGRMKPCKRWERAVDIVDRVRRAGVNLDFTLISHRDDPHYGRRIAALAESRPWFRILWDLSRKQLTQEMASCRYGIHNMEDEHFGIAVAEMLRGGVIPFVHDSGGPVEIVGGREELRFREADEAVRKICAVVVSPTLEQDIRGFLCERRDLFTTARFCERLRALVRDFPDGWRPPTRTAQ
jgi:glycosyltransferase involved in cell wall biosynthesis